MKSVLDRLTGTNILFLLRSGAATDFITLLETLGIAGDEYLSLHCRVARTVEQLAQAGLVEIKHEGEDEMRFMFTAHSGKPVSIAITSLWERIQTALDISLTELAAYVPYNSLIVGPYFGKPRKLKDTESSDIFVLMPFQNELKPVYEDHIRKVASSLKLSVKRADDFFTADSVMRDIWAAICTANIVVADCTGRNPNVFYEIGLAHTVGKPVILITQNSEDVPFDLRHIRYINYHLTPRGMKEFEKTLAETIRSITDETG